MQLARRRLGKRESNPQASAAAKNQFLFLKHFKSLHFFVLCIFHLSSLLSSGLRIPFSSTVLLWPGCSAYPPPPSRHTFPFTLLRFTGGNAGFWACVFNLANAAMGAGVLAFPFAYEKAGYVLGTVMAVVGGLLFCFTLNIVGTASDEAFRRVSSHTTLEYKMQKQKTEMKINKRKLMVLPHTLPTYVQRCVVQVAPSTECLHAAWTASSDSRSWVGVMPLRQLAIVCFIPRPNQERQWSHKDRIKK